MSMSRARLLLVIVVLCAAVGVGGWVLGQGFRMRDARSSAQLFESVLAHVASRYVDSIDVGTLYNRAAAGLVAELDDPHSVFLDSARLARVQATVTGLSGTLGFEVDARDGWIVVMSSLAGSPAEQVGLRTNDRIVSIDGRSTRNLTADEARRLLRGAPGTSVRISVVRFGTAGETELTMEREAVYRRPVDRVMILEGNIGLVNLRTFSDSAALELSSSIDSLYRLGMRKLILDLRGNPGGLLAQGTAVADLFLNPGQTIVSLRGRTAESQRKFVDSLPQPWKDLRMAVLVNRGTASAAEIVAGALQDHDRAVVIGRPTYGKGSAQHIYSFHDQAGVKLTTARWYTPSGRNIDMHGSPADTQAAPGDTARPAFKTDSGRTVYGGGGIVPDILAGDPPVPPRVQLFAALGGNARKFWQLMQAEAKAIAARGLRDPMFDVTPAMRDALFARLQSAGLKIPRKPFDGAAEWIDIQLGAMAVNAALGRPAESRRQMLKDKVVQQAMQTLREQKP